MTVGSQIRGGALGAISLDAAITSALLMFAISRVEGPSEAGDALVLATLSALPGIAAYASAVLAQSPQRSMRMRNALRAFAWVESGASVMAYGSRLLSPADPDTAAHIGLYFGPPSVLLLGTFGAVVYFSASVVRGWLASGRS